MKTKHTHGFTIIELLITVVIAGILTIIVLPGMQNLLSGERLTSYTNALLNDMMYARSKAVEENVFVFLCASNDEANCTNTDFEDGWIVLIDRNDDELPNAGDELIKVQQSIAGDISFSLNDPALVSITFDDRGFTPNSRGTISVCDERGDPSARTLTLTPTGRVSREADPEC